MRLPYCARLVVLLLVVMPGTIAADQTRSPFEVRVNTVVAFSVPPQNSTGFEPGCTPFYRTGQELPPGCIWFEGEEPWHSAAVLSRVGEPRAVAVGDPRHWFSIRATQETPADAPPVPLPQIAVNLWSSDDRQWHEATEHSVRSMKWLAARGVFRNLVAGEYEACVEVREASFRECTAVHVLPVTSYEDRLELLRRLAVGAIREGQYQDAVGLVDELLAAHPGSAPGYHLKGVIADHTNRLEDAILAYGRAIEIYETGADALIQAFMTGAVNLDGNLGNWRKFLQGLVDNGMRDVPDLRPRCPCP